MKKILIVVDMQNDFITGSLGSKEAIKIVPAVIQKIKQYEEDGYPIVFTRDTHTEEYLTTQEGKWLPVLHCTFHTEGWNIPQEILAATEAPIIVDKDTFGLKDWERVLASWSFDEIEMVGVCTDICVVTNALRLKTLYPEIPVTIDARCCAGVTPESHQSALNTMKMCQCNIINNE